MSERQDLSKFVGNINKSVKREQAEMNWYLIPMRGTATFDGESEQISEIHVYASTPENAIALVKSLNGETPPEIERYEVEYPERLIVIYTLCDDSDQALAHAKREAKKRRYPVSVGDGSRAYYGR